VIPAEALLPVQVLFAAPVAAILLGFFVVRRVAPTCTHWPILASCAGITWAALKLLAFVAAGHTFDAPVWRWIAVGGLEISFGLRIDGASAAVLAMVAVVGSLIHVYAAGYMKGDPGFARFFLVFHLFFLAMIALLTAHDYVQLYLAWELVGVASYLLVGFWWHKDSARKAALKAFMTNRVGDLGFLVAVLGMVFAFGTTKIELVHARLAAVLVDQPEVVAIIAIGLFWAACAKSAQWPLYWWLPDAMEGPTPTSALMHAATMVTAGVFLLARAWPIVAAVEGLPHVIACVGAGTALFAAVLAGTRKDLKQILAYSTVSHLGLMMLALGLGQVGVALFHLIVHGFFKAVLFLCAGNIAHALHQSTASIDDVGALRRAMPLTHLCFAVAALSLAGIWPLAGFWSKDAILDAAWHHGGLFPLVGMLIAAGSAFYIFRMMFLAFYGNREKQRKGGAHPHEAGLGLVLPIALLCIGAIGAGFLAQDLQDVLDVQPATGIPRANLELPHADLVVAGLGTAMAALGFLFALSKTIFDPAWDWRWRGGAAEEAFDSDLGWKTFCDGVARAVSSVAGIAGRIVDKAWWDAGIEHQGDLARAAAGRFAATTQGRINDYLWWMLAGAALLLSSALA